MKTFFTFLFLFLIQFSSFGQAKITREVTKFWDVDLLDWRNVSEIIYQYNSSKETTLQQESYWSESENKFIGESKTTFEYYDFSRFISDYRSIYDNNELYWILSDTSKYILNEAGCEIQFFEDGEFITWRQDNEYFENCMIKSTTSYFKNRDINSDNWQPFERILYNYSNNNKLKRFTAEKYEGFGEWSFLYEGYEKFDDRGNLIEKFNTDNQKFKFENTYDNEDRLINQLLFTPSGPNDELTKRRESQYEYFEDENGYLVKKLLHRRYKDDIDFLTHTFLYENYCDGLIKTEEYIRYDGTRRMWSYQYDEPTNCMENEAFSAQILPNPNDGSFKIVSDLLLQNTNISVYSSNGQLILELPFSERSDYREFNFSDLQNGAYFIRLKNGEKSITEPFIILK